MYGIVVSILLTNTNLDAFGFGFFQHGVGIRQAHRHRFFDNQVYAEIQDGKCNFCPNAAIDGKTDDIDLVFFEHLLEIGVGLGLGKLKFVPNGIHGSLA